VEAGNDFLYHHQPNQSKSKPKPNKQKQKQTLDVKNREKNRAFLLHKIHQNHWPMVWYDLKFRKKSTGSITNLKTYWSLLAKIQF